MPRCFLGKSLLTRGSVLLFAAFLSLPGCGGEPTGEAGFSQKFEAPEGAIKEDATLPNPADERRSDSEKSRETPPPAKSGKAKR